MPKLILGSSSPRRIELLNSVGFTADEILHANIDETPHKSEKPFLYVERMALQKSEAIQNILGSRDDFSDSVWLTADTIVVCANKILGKPADEIEARQMMKQLSGRRHTVATCICVASALAKRIRIVKTVVKFKRLDTEDVDLLIQSNQWKTASGGYMIQGIAGSFVHSMMGQVSNVVGLPLLEASNLLKSFHIHRNIISRS